MYCLLIVDVLLVWCCLVVALLQGIVLVGWLGYDCYIVVVCVVAVWLIYCITVAILLLCCFIADVSLPC